MKIFKIAVLLMMAAWLPRLALANLVGPYTLDTNTVLLLHFDEPSGTTSVTNQGTLGRNFLSTTITSSGAALVNLLGGTGYSTNLPTAISFGGCMSNGIANNSLGFGCDYNNDGVFTNSTTIFNDFVPMSLLNMGNGGSTPWTVEALVQPSISPLPNQTCCIITADCSIGTTGTRRALLFRIVASGGVYTINLIAVTPGGGASFTSSGIIPATGPDALVSNAWYHAAATYDGTNVTLYWTRMDPANGAAHVLSVTPQTLGASWGGNSSPLIIGNTGRGGNSAFPGCIDEVRISKVCRAANQMQFYSPLVTITQNPVSQNVDYNQPVTFSVGATTTGSTMGYQWRFNSNSIAGATNTTYTIPNVASFNAGYYDCVVTNTAGYSNMTTEAHLVVGAANFLSHRYSFTTNYVDPTSGLVCTADSIGSANGTNFGNASISGGQLVLDGSSGTYMQLPGGLYTSSGATALTVEFWATFGTNVNNTWLWLFTSSYNGTGGPPAGFFGFLCNNGSGFPETRAGRSLQVDESVIASNSLNGVSMHIACTIDPPHKTIAIYTNGVLAAINTNAPVAISDVSDTFSFIGCLGSGPGPFLNANINELRIYNGALSPITIKQSDDQGPNVVLASGPVQFVIQPGSVTVPAGQTATFTAAAVGYLPISYQWFKNSMLVPGATNASYSFATTLADNNASIYCQATNTIGVTTYVTNSTTAMLNVFLPPTLSWLGTTDGGQDNYWNTSSLDWTNDPAGGGVLSFTQTNGVLFDDRSGGGTVDVQQSILPYNITVNAASDYILTSSGGLGSLTGPGSLSKQNSGTLIMDLSSSMTGPVTISAGKLQVGNNDSNGTLGSSPITNNATLSINRADTSLNLGNNIHGTGTLSIDGSGAVTISGNSDFSGSTLINVGIVYLTSPTGLGAPSGGTTVANNAQLYLKAGINFSKPLTLNGSGDGNGALRKGGSSATTSFGPITLASDTAIGVDGGSTLYLTNVINGGGALTVVGSGPLVLSGVSNNWTGGTTINSGSTLQIGDGGADGNAGISGITNNGTLTVLSASTILWTNQVSGAGTFNQSGIGRTVLSNSPLANFTGAVRITGNGQLGLAPGETLTNQASLTLGAAQADTNCLQLTGGNLITDPISISPRAFIGTLGGGLPTVNYPNVVNLNGTNILNPPSQVNIPIGGNLFTLESDGGYLIFSNGVNAAGAGRFFVMQGTGSGEVDGPITQSSGYSMNVYALGSGIWALNGLSSYTGTTVVSNGTLVVNGEIDSSPVTVAGGTIGGIGTLTGPLVVNTGAKLAPTLANAPGTPIGVLTVNNSLTLQPGSFTAMQINQAAGTNDVITGLTDITYGGTLVVTNVAGNLIAGYSFQLFSATTSSNNFSAVTGALPGGLGWSFNPTNGVLSVIATVNTNPTNITATVSGATLTLSWPADHTGWRLLMQTNNLTKGISTNTNDWATVSGSPSTNQVNIIIDPAKPAEFYRMVYP